MSFDIDGAIGSMAGAMQQSIGEGVEDILSYAAKVLSQQKQALAELAAARQSGELNEAEFQEELEREMLVVESEMLAVVVVSKAAIQKAIQAAIGVLTRLVMP